MKLCQHCGQALAEEILTCPACGSEVRQGRSYIDDYRIADVLHEGYSSILCRAIKDGTDKSLMIRIFTLQSGVNEDIAGRLRRELEELKKLPEDYFVRHFEVRRSSDGLWYRVSEWVDAENWGTLLASGALDDYHVAFKLFARIASILEGLHRIGHFIPHLILDDILVFKGEGDGLEVKIDYKLSRFLDPDLDRPGPMLKALLSRHPDITHQRPLDFRSDIWSLGKIFIELLTADYNILDFKDKIEKLALPHEAEVLFKIMLADDPNLRPQSMSAVAETLTRIDDKDIEIAMQRRHKTAPLPAREIIGLKRWVRLLVILILIFSLLAGFIWYYLASKTSDSEAILSEFANQYAGAVAFVMVEYWVEDESDTYYRNRTEGTAFLVDRQGYLLTNRHVACPWLEDKKFYSIINRFSHDQHPLRLEYRIYLWFEGQKAFKRLPDVWENIESVDMYFLDSAYSTLGPQHLAIAGVGKAPVKTWQRIRSPLGNDFAVLKIETVPANIHPLPLDHKMNPLKIQKLSPVIALGFPLGSSAQEHRVNVSVTRGHVRRAFENFLQVDSSLYRGNSGGPIIDLHGKVIGIASSVAVDYSTSLMSVATPLSDLGMVLPITKAADFLSEIKAGRLKWNGVLDLAVKTKIKQITDLADQRKWQSAMELADRELHESPDPALIMTAAIMHFCTEDFQGADRLFKRALSMDSENGQAQMMLYLIDWLNNASAGSPHRQALIHLDWRSPHEFFGYLVTLIEDKVDETTAMAGGDTAYEFSWLRYIAGLKAAKKNNLVSAENLFKEAVLAAESDSWIFYLALAGLEKVQQQRFAVLKDSSRQNTYQSEIEETNAKLTSLRQYRSEKRQQLVPLITRLRQPGITPKEKKSLLEEMRRINPTDSRILIALIYLDTMIADWRPALENIRTFLAHPGRENRDRLRTGLLEAELLKLINEPSKAEMKLKAFKQGIHDRWYRNIAECLLAEKSVQSLISTAMENPQYILTANTALGLWAEGNGDRQLAVTYYREALASYLDYLEEYELARERIRMLRVKKE